MVLEPPANFPGEILRKTNPQRKLSSAEESMIRSLIALDERYAQEDRKRRSSFAYRIFKGVTDHFRNRIAEWFATLLLMQFGWILYGPTDVFPHSPNFSVMAQWADESTWGAICLTLGGIHWVALTINGSFPSFRFSPHVRATASFLACFVWFQITLAIYMSGVGGTGFGTYRLVFLLEIWNFIHACQDVGTSEGRRAAHVR